MNLTVKTFWRSCCSRSCASWGLVGLLAWASALGLRAQEAPPPPPPPPEEAPARGDLPPGNGPEHPPGPPPEAEAPNSPQAPNPPGTAAPTPSWRSRQMMPAGPMTARPSVPATNAPTLSAAPTNTTPAPAPAPTEEATPEVPNPNPNSLEYSAFRIVADRNIFDPNRYPHTGVRRVTRTLEAFSLVGTMSYDKGTFAFFDGTSSEYRKVLKAGQKIAGYRLEAVLADAVTLAKGSNHLNLAVGKQMRRQDDGAWVMGAGSTSYSAVASNSSTPSDSISTNPSTSSTPSSTPSSGAESDVLKRLMERRAKE